MPKYNEKTGKALFGQWSDEKIPLSNNMPISLTFYKIGESIIVDPTLEEQDIIETRVTLGITKEGVSSMQKGEKESLSVDEMYNILDLSEKVWNEIFKKIEKYFK
jgi:exosome complex component RRP42